MTLVYTIVVVRVKITCNIITFIEGISGTYEPLKLLTAQFYERPTITKAGRKSFSLLRAPALKRGSLRKRSSKFL